MCLQKTGFNVWVSAIILSLAACGPAKKLELAQETKKELTSEAVEEAQNQLTATMDGTEAGQDVNLVPDGDLVPVEELTDDEIIARAIASLESEIASLESFQVPDIKDVDFSDLYESMQQILAGAQAELELLQSDTPEGQAERDRLVNAWRNPPMPTLPDGFKVPQSTDGSTESGFTN